MRVVDNCRPRMKLSQPTKAMTMSGTPHWAMFSSGSLAAADWTDSKLTPHGTGITPFQPTSLALAAGASFVARGFSGDPNGLAKLLVEAIEHPGFSFVQALSPCKTFRPEQMEWKKHVRGFDTEATDDAALAAERIRADDGMSTGVIYRRAFPVYQPGGAEPAGDAAQFDREFVI